MRVVNRAVLPIARPELIIRAREAVPALGKHIGPGVVAGEGIPDHLGVVPHAAQVHALHAGDLEGGQRRAARGDGHRARILPADGAVRHSAAERQRVSPGLQLREGHRPVDGDRLRRATGAAQRVALERDGIAIGIQVRTPRRGRHPNAPGGGRGSGFGPLTCDSDEKERRTPGPAPGEGGRNRVHRFLQGWSRAVLALTTTRCSRTSCAASPSAARAPCAVSIRNIGKRGIS